MANDELLAGQLQKTSLELNQLTETLLGVAKIEYPFYRSLVQVSDELQALVTSRGFRPFRDLFSKNSLLSDLITGNKFAAYHKLEMSNKGKAQSSILPQKNENTQPYTLFLNLDRNLVYVDVVSFYPEMRVASRRFLYRGVINRSWSRVLPSSGLSG